MSSKLKTGKICFLIPVLVAGGAERVLSEIINYFDQNVEAELHLVLYGKKKELFYSLPINTIIHQPTVEFKDKWRLLSTIERAVFVRRTVKSIKPTTVLSFGEYWNSFVLFALIGLKLPVFISDRNQPNKSLGKLHDALRKWLYPKAMGMIAQTEKAKSAYIDLKLNKNIRTIGNPIRSISHLEITEKKNIVLSVGRLIDTKNHIRLINIFFALNLKDWQLIIVGGDALKQNNQHKLQLHINKLKLNDRIVLTGNVKNVDDYYLKSKIFAFTSSSEGFPNVIGEAMSAGLPVVAYDCVAGPSEMIEDGKTGYLIKLFDDEEFKEKLKSLMINEEVRKSMGAAANESIKKFSVDKIGKQYVDFILP